MGGSEVRMRPVTAYPSIGGSRGNRHFTAPETKPSARVRTFSLSMAFETLQVSSWRRLSRVALDTEVWDVISAKLQR
jgi:hypothetical protein